MVPELHEAVSEKSRWGPEEILLSLAFFRSLALSLILLSKLMVKSIREFKEVHSSRTANSSFISPANPLRKMA